MWGWAEPAAPAEDPFLIHQKKKIKLLMDQLAKLTSQMGRTASDLSTAMSQQREQLDGIDESVTATSKSTSRLDASQKKRLAKLEGRGARSSSSSSGATAAVGWAASKTRSI